jgi:hypothetical protein
MEWYLYPILVIAGILVGFINTLSGSGSLITLPLLMYLGLPANVANGTNRVAILLQSMVGTGSFLKQKVIRVKDGIWLSVPAVVGALIGALFAADLNENVLRKVIGGLMVVMVLLMLFKPEAWIKGKAGYSNARPGILKTAMFFGIGLYGGFIQAGIGFFLLGGLVLGAGMDLMKANALKNMIIMLYTPFALAIFIWNHQVNWPIGLTLAAGNMVGAWIGAHMAVKRGTNFIRVVMLIVISIAAADMLGLFRMIHL